MIGLEAQVNAQGGIKGPDGKPHPLRVIMYDDQSQESQTVLVAKRLIQEDKVSVIIGSSQSGTTLAMVDTVQQAQVPLISAAANAGIVQPVANRKWVFKTPQNDELVMSALLDWLTSKSVTKVAWISVNNAFGDGGRTQFDKLASGYGVCAVANERFGAADPDMTAQLTKIKGTDSQAIVVWACPPAASTVTRNAVDLGIKLPIFRSRRVIDIEPRVVAVLRRHRAAQEMEHRVAGAASDASIPDLVFTTPTGAPIDGRTLIRTGSDGAFDDRGDAGSLLPRRAEPSTGGREGHGGGAVRMTWAYYEEL